MSGCAIWVVVILWLSFGFVVALLNAYPLGADPEAIDLPLSDRVAMAKCRSKVVRLPLGVFETCGKLTGDNLVDRHESIFLCSIGREAAATTIRFGKTGHDNNSPRTLRENAAVLLPT